MSNPSNQVRSALTKEWIFNALMILMQTKNLNNISITEVCTKAGVSRMGFYRNYNIIEDVIVERIDQVFADFLIRHWQGRTLIIIIQPYYFSNVSGMRKS